MTILARTVCLHDRGQIEGFLRRDPLLHFYSLGDLDDRFWPSTTWYALTEQSRIGAVALVYSGLSRPTLLALGREEELPQLESLLRSLVPLLPRCFYAHLSPGLSGILQSSYPVATHGPHFKMALTDPSRLGQIDTSAAVRLTEADTDELLRFYAESYPGHWFERGSLQAGPYYAVRKSDGLAAVAGVHVYSEQYRVAALGNIATHPACRRCGHATAAVAALWKGLLGAVDRVGLNVKADNAAAVRCYQRLGFQIVAEYEECEVGKRACESFDFP